MNLTGKLLRINEDHIFYPLHMQTEGDFELFSGGLLMIVLDEITKYGVRNFTVLCRFGIGHVGYLISKKFNYEVVA